MNDNKITVFILPMKVYIVLYIKTIQSAEFNKHNHFWTIHHF